MAIQRLEEVPGVCENNKCSSAGCFELYDTDEVKTDKKGDYVECYDCGRKIYLEG